MGSTASRVVAGIATGGLSEAVRPFTKNLMKNLMKTPTPPESPPPPTTDSKATQQAVAEATARRSRARGFQSTILSNPGSTVGGPKTTIGS